jgi:hypothetical protein
MIELDLAHLSRRDTCDCVKRDIDHRNTLLGLLLFSEEFALRHVGAPRRYFHSLSVL